MFGIPRTKQQGRVGWANENDWVMPYLIVASQFRDNIRKAAIGKEMSEINALTSNFEAEMGHLGVYLNKPNHTHYVSQERTELLQRFVKAFRYLYLGATEASQREAPPKDYLTLCDEYRDIYMIDLGVSVDDTDLGAATITFIDRQSLIATREAKRAVESEKKAAKARAEEVRAKEQAEKDKRGRVKPQDLFKTTDYSQWDAQVDVS